MDKLLKTSFDIYPIPINSMSDRELQHRLFSTDISLGTVHKSRDREGGLSWPLLTVTVNFTHKEFVQDEVNQTLEIVICGEKGGEGGGVAPIFLKNVVTWLMDGPSVFVSLRMGKRKKTPVKRPPSTPPVKLQTLQRGHDGSFQTRMDIAVLAQRGFPPSHIMKSLGVTFDMAQRWCEQSVKVRWACVKKPTILSILQAYRKMWIVLFFLSFYA